MYYNEGVYAKSALTGLNVWEGGLDPFHHLVLKHAVALAAVDDDGIHASYNMSVLSVGRQTIADLLAPLHSSRDSCLAVQQLHLHPHAGLKSNNCFYFSLFLRSTFSSQSAWVPLHPSSKPRRPAQTAQKWRAPAATSAFTLSWSFCLVPMAAATRSCLLLGSWSQLRHGCGFRSFFPRFSTPPTPRSFFWGGGFSLGCVSACLFFWGGGIFLFYSRLGHYNDVLYSIFSHN